MLLILERCQAGEWRLLSSEAVDYEISRIPDIDRRRKVFHLASVARVKQVVSEAVQTRAEVFLTTDDQLLAKAKQYGNILRVRVANPILWLMEVTSDGSSKGAPGRD